MDRTNVSVFYAERSSTQIINGCLVILNVRITSEVDQVEVGIKHGDRRVTTNRAIGEHHLYDLDVDPDEGENRTGEAREVEMLELLRTALQSLEAPDDQFERLGIA